MKRKSIRATPVALLCAAALLATAATANATSHREAPLIRNQTVVDTTDVYVFQGIDRGAAQLQVGSIPQNATGNTYSGSPQMPTRQVDYFDKSRMETTDLDRWFQ